ncbi:MAG TPA: hypothetical protein V6C76_11200 [Drouetiella sp.]
MKLKTFIVVVAGTMSIVLGSSQTGTAQPATVRDASVDASNAWCHDEEAKLEKSLKLPKDFDEKKSGKLRAIVLFNVKDAHAINLKNLRKNKNNHADWPTITVPEQTFSAVEKSMMDAVKATQPFKPLPASLSDAGVSFAYEPNGKKRIRVIVFMENP